MCKTNYITKHKIKVGINIYDIEQLILDKQKKIYETSKKCRINQLIKLQKCFYENKIYSLVVLKKLLNSFQKKHLFSNCYANKIVFYIFFSIRNMLNSICNAISFFKAKLDEAFAYILLKPEWESRYEVFLSTTDSDNKIKDIISTTSLYRKIYDKYYIRLYAPNTFPNCKSIINKINTFTAISRQLKQLLEAKYKTNDVKNSHKIDSHAIYGNSFKQLLQHIMSVGLEWHIYANLKIKSVYRQMIYICRQQEAYLMLANIKLASLIPCTVKFINSLSININSINLYKSNYSKYCIKFNDVNILTNSLNNISIEPSQISVKRVFVQAKHILYHKNTKGLWRINTDINARKMSCILNSLLFAWYANFKHAANKKTISNVNYGVNHMINKWQRKR